MSALHQAFLHDFQLMSRNGGLESGGVERQAATAADGLNRQWFAGWLAARGATVHYDEIGNQFGTFELHPGAPYVLVGSHLDSQPRAGRFDGAYGVLAGATVCAELYRAASNPEQWRAMSQAAAERARKLTWDHVAAQHEVAYTRCAGERLNA